MIFAAFAVNVCINYIFHSYLLFYYRRSW